MTPQQLTDWLKGFVAALLDVEPDEVAADVRLEILGVDSAATLVMIADLGDRLGREVRPAEVLDHPTIESLATHLSVNAPVEAR